MGWNDHLEEESERQDVIQALIDSGKLDDPALGVAKKVFNQGESSLVGKQVNVFKFITEKYLELECKRCHAQIPVSELVEAWDEDGLCSWCIKMESNDGRL